MKITILLLLLSLLSLDIQAQFRAEDEVKRIDLKLESFRKQHQIGTLMALSGVVVSSIPLLIGFDLPDSDRIFVLGGVLSLSGIITTIDSYKHLKLESKRTVVNKAIRYPAR